MALSLTLYPGDSLTIGSDVSVVIKKIQAKRIELSVSAPKDHRIERKHLKKNNNALTGANEGGIHER